MSTFLSTFLTIHRKEMRRWRVFSSDRLHLAGFCIEGKYSNKQIAMKIIKKLTRLCMEHIMLGAMIRI